MTRMTYFRFIAPSVKHSAPSVTPRVQPGMRLETAPQTNLPGFGLVTKLRQPGGRDVGRRGGRRGGAGWFCGNGGPLGCAGCPFRRNRGSRCCRPGSRYCRRGSRCGGGGSRGGKRGSFFSLAIPFYSGGHPLARPHHPNSPAAKPQPHGRETDLGHAGGLGARRNNRCHDVVIAG